MIQQNTDGVVTGGRAFFRNTVKGYEPVVFRSWYEKMWVEEAK